MYDFEPFHIDAVKRQLSRSGEILPLTAKAFDTLLILIRNHGRTVSKHEIIEEVWCDTAVEENNLAQQISVLRKLLGDDARHPEFIITIPGQGYSFIAPIKIRQQNSSETVLPENEISRNPSESAEAENQTRTRKNNIFRSATDFSRNSQAYGLLFTTLFLAVAIFSTLYFTNFSDSKPSICVLPFKSLINNERSNLYSAGIPSFVTAKIGNLPEMIVRPTNLSGEYYGQEQNVIEIGRTNDADAVLTGSTLCEGDVLQVTVHLWDVKNKRQIWAKVFTGNAADAINLQDKISEEIIYALRNELLN